MDSSKFTSILTFYRRNKRMPSYAEIAKLMKFKSKNAAYKLVNAMIAAGFVERDSQGKLIPKKLFSDLRLLGTVEAGFPSPAEEELVDTMTLDEYLIGNHRDSTYLLRVKGDSMIDAGIMPGDMVLVERGVEARDGDIVIAEVDHEWTMKYLQKRSGKMTLIPANKNYPPIEPHDELKIAAVVRGVVRKY